MVNLKASGHQGERKRTQAGAEHGVSKAEKLSLKAKDGGLLSVVNKNGIALKVVAREKVITDESNMHAKSALVCSADFQTLCAGEEQGRVQFCRPGGDMVLSARKHEACSAGEVLLSEAQRLSLHVCEDEVYEWVPYAPSPAEREGLAWLSLETQLLQPLADGMPPLEVDAKKLGQAASKWLFDELVSDNELFIVAYAETHLVLRVTGLGRCEAEEELGDGTGAVDAAHGAADSAATHCYRGMVSARTMVYVGASTAFKSSAQSRKVSDGLGLVGVQKPPTRAPRNCVHVHTSDGETFPVHRLLLKPCIALTKLVRAATAAAKAGVQEEATSEASVSVDCATFDRVLLFLEAHARGTVETFSCDISTLETLNRAGASLGCRPLVEWCGHRLGDFESRIRMHHWTDVVAANDAGGCIVTMDGMVFDLEAWLPEHPGGSTIIPQQALNKDCTVFFELYHASRESFTYLREFYIGEVWKDERDQIPLEKELPSADFMAQLREFSAPFRYSPDANVVAHKSF
jgi:cytochrome b involved in lipid metabolism